MNYRNIENEIDILLQSGGLNAYERKFLRKIKRHLSSKNHRLNRAVSLMTSFKNSSYCYSKKLEKMSLILKGRERDIEAFKQTIRENIALKDKAIQRFYVLAAFSLVITTAFVSLLLKY